MDMAAKGRNHGIGARNPYALAELVQGKKINWSTQSSNRAISKLENAFDMPAERLFNPKYNSPVFRRNISDIINAASGSLLSRSGSSQQLMTYCLLADWQQFTGNYITAAGMDGIDPVQSGLLKNCSLIAAMASCAWVGKGAWYKSVTQNLPVQSSYSLQFYDYNSTVRPASPSSKLPQVPLGNLIYAKSATVGECWPSIIEKAYYQSRDSIRGIITDTPDLEYYNDVTTNPTGVPAAVLYQLLNTEPIKRSKTLNGSDYNEGMIWSNLLSICQGRVPNLKIRYPAVAYSFDSVQAGWKPGTISPQHSYSILGLAGTVDTATPPNWKTKYIVLRDPWAVTTDPGFASPEMLTSGSWINSINFAAKDGIFALRSDLFPMYFQGYAYAVV